MVNILNAVQRNYLEAVEILKKAENNTIVFAIWNDKEGYYQPKTTTYDGADLFPWVDVDIETNAIEGTIAQRLVVAARYNTKLNTIEIMTAPSTLTESNGIFHELYFCHGISYWSVLEHIQRWDDRETKNLLKREKLYVVTEISNICGNERVNTTPCWTLEDAKKVMEDHFTKALQSNQWYKDITIDDIREGRIPANNSKVIYTGFANDTILYLGIDLKNGHYEGEKAYITEKIII